MDESFFVKEKKLGLSIIIDFLSMILMILIHMLNIVEPYRKVIAKKKL